MTNKLKINALGLSLLVVFLLSACGQKRALYLPENPQSNNPTTDSEKSAEPAVEGKD